jgi:hypothetical protein
MTERNSGLEKGDRRRQAIKVKLKPFVGKWILVEMEAWDQEFVNMEVPGHFTLSPETTTRKAEDRRSHQHRQSGVGSVARVPIPAFWFPECPQPHPGNRLRCDVQSCQLSHRTLPGTA